MIDEARESGDSAGATDETAMQADSHHLRHLRPFGIERIERTAQVLEEKLRRRQVLVPRHTAVVGIETMRHDEMRAPPGRHPIGKIISIGIAVVEEAAVL